LAQRELDIIVKNNVMYFHGVYDEHTKTKYENNQKIIQRDGAYFFY
jgi:hypothetical protein